MDKLLGREAELAQLEGLQQKSTASLAVIRGRRRIGKSTLARYFGEHNATTYLEFPGLAPRAGQGNQEQLNNFAKLMEVQLGVSGFRFNDWMDALSMLARHIPKRRTVVLLDELSWMAQHDLDFPGKLKIAWDTAFSQQSKLVLILCGSVSAWMEKNILRSADFVGRISLDLVLREIPLCSVSGFWGERADRISAAEKLRILVVTGGVPKYLEEVRPQFPSVSEINRLCFLPGGFLFDEFEKIFNDIFQRRASIYREIVKCLVERKLSASEIAKKLGGKQNSDLSEYLNDLEMSGFLARDYVYKFGGERSKLSRYRISDNYLRFYLKYIEPLRSKVKLLGTAKHELEQLVNWASVQGLQFENLLLNNLPAVFRELGISARDLISAAPYFQRKLATNNGSCQIDLLIECRFQTLYVCEFKTQARLDARVISEMKRKIKTLNPARAFSIRPVLIYSGEIEADQIGEFEAFFDKMVPFRKFLGER